MFYRQILRRFGGWTPSSAAAGASQQLRAVVFALVTLVPACCGAVQSLIWRAYGLDQAAVAANKRRLVETRDRDSATQHDV